MTGTGWVPLRTAWEAALYGPAGFYRREHPADHFRTSVHSSALFAAAVVELARRHGLTSVWDVGAGEGELLRQIHAAAPELSLVGVDLRARPARLPDSVGWQSGLPTRCDGLVFANELLDTVPCDVVELDAGRRCCIVEVEPETGDERLGEPAAPADLAWVDAWWPLVEVGQRAEVGRPRERFWAGLLARVGNGVCVAVDYGHLAGDRPRWGTMSSYRGGAQTPVTFDGSHDITAHVALDSLAASVGGTLRRQRDVLHELGVDGSRPPLSRASEDPAGYLRDLSRATEAAELTAVGGLGDFGWLLTARP